MKELEFSIEIQATKQAVWTVLWRDDTFRQWAGIIDPGTYMAGELTEGSEIQFISAENGYGVTSFVETLRQNEYLLLRHRVDTKNAGQEERKDEWTGGAESYALEETADGTILSVTFDVPEHMEAYFAKTYPKVMQTIKTLAENSGH